MSDSKADKGKSQRGWKRHLLSSGIPLEFEIARLLTDMKMVVDADFAFTRSNGAENSEGSVDLYSYLHESVGRNDLAYKLSFLIEVKYRSPQKTPLLLPVQNHYAPTLGFTTTVIDSLCPVHINSAPIYSLEDEMDYAYKGIEIYEDGAIEREFRHGLEQLRYAAPVVVRNEIDFSAGNVISDAVPIFITKILVTNAPIRILNEDASLKEVESATSLDEISKRIRYSIIFSEYGPDYKDHMKSVFSSDSETRNNAVAERLEDLQDSGKEISRYSDPTRMLRELTTGETDACRRIGTQFYVSDLEGLPQLIKDIRQACRRSYRARTKADMFMRRVKSGLGDTDARPEYTYTRP